MGSFIPVTGINSYVVTPELANHAPQSRNSAVATLVNVTATPKNAASYDDTYNLTKCTATGASPSVTKTSVGTLSERRVSASVWVKGDATLTPGTITLTLTDGSGGQSVSSDITNDGTLQRYSIAGYFDSSSTTVKLKVSWTSTTGVVYLDGWQIEANDWATECFENTSSTAETDRTVFADPLRLSHATPYKNGTRMTWNEVLQLDKNLYPFDHIASPTSVYRFYSTKGNMLNLDNVESGVHIMYRTKRKSPLYTDGAQVIDIPAPEVWTMLQGIIAFQKCAMYDIGANKESGRAMTAFADAVEEMIMTSVEAPAWSYIDVNTAAMMR